MKYYNIICQKFFHLLILTILSCGFVFFNRVNDSLFFEKYDYFLNPSSDKNIFLSSAVKNNLFFNQASFFNNNFSLKTDVLLRLSRVQNCSWYKKEIAATPIFTVDRVFVFGKDGILKCFNRNDGNVIWQYQIVESVKKNKEFYSLSFQKGLILVAAECKVFIFNKDGKEVFYQELTSPAVSCGVLDDNSYLHLQTMYEYIKYDIKLGISSLKVPCVVGDINHRHNFSPILYNGGVLYKKGYDAFEYIPINKTDSRISFITQGFLSQIGLSELQDFPFSSLGNVSCQPILFRDHLFVAFANKVIVKIDLFFNKIVWSKIVPCVNQISQVGNTLFATTFSGRAIALDIDTSDIIWKINLGYKLSSSFLPPVIVNDNIFLFSKREKEIIKLSAKEGKILNRLRVKGIKRCDILSLFPIEDSLFLFTNRKIIQFK